MEALQGLQLGRQQQSPIRKCVEMLFQQQTKPVLPQERMLKQDQLPIITNWNKENDYPQCVRI